MFDPYHKWLGIPKDQRPPTYYQLLGISPDETDVEVIKEGALRQTAHVRTYQTGPRAQDCTQLLNEIATARATLLNPVARTEYDSRLALAALMSTRQPGPLSPELPGKLSFWREPAALGYIALLLLGWAVAFCLTSHSLNETSAWQSQTRKTTRIVKPSPGSKAPVPVPGKAK
jgi:hypothetical protein